MVLSHSQWDESDDALSKETPTGVVEVVDLEEGHESDSVLVIEDQGDSMEVD